MSSKQELFISRCWKAVQLSSKQELVYQQRLEGNLVEFKAGIGFSAQTGTQPNWVQGRSWFISRGWYAIKLRSKQESDSLLRRERNRIEFKAGTGFPAETGMQSN